MDFPNEVETNVYRLIHVKEVYWRFCSAAGVDESEAGDELQDDPVVSNYWRLSNIECQLCHNGELVYYEIERNGIWLFSFESERLPQLVEHNGLQENSHGILRTVDLENASASRGPSMKPLQAGVPTPSGQNLGKASGETSTKAIDVYPKLIAAVSCSLSFSMGRFPDWCRLDYMTCVHVAHLDLENEWPNTNLEDCTQLLVFEVRWLSSGALTLTTVVSDIPRVRRLSQNLDLDIGSNLLLAPFSIPGVYAGSAIISKRNRKSKIASNILALVSVLLTQYGISISEETQWARVKIAEMPSESSRSEIDSIFDSMEILWPSYLCLYRAATTSPGETKDDMEKPHDSRMRNPLDWVEAWSTSKQQRVNALEATRREMETSARYEKDANESDNGEVASNMISPANQYINPQDISGIYPTPPDGLPSQTYELSTGDEPHGQQQEPGDERKADIMETSPYETHEIAKQDLFGDLDMDIFTENGLTEADFNFFDDPQNAEDDVLTNSIVSAEEMARIVESGQDIKSAAISSPQLTSQSTLQPAKQEPQQTYELPQHETTEDNVSSPALVSQANTGGMVFDQKPNDGHDDKVLEVGAVAISHDSQEPVESRGLGFDEKYSASGRFGFDVHVERQSSRGPTGIKSLDRKLPRIGMPDGHSSDTEEDLDIENSLDEDSEGRVKLHDVDVQRSQDSPDGEIWESNGILVPSTPFSPDSAFQNEGLETTRVSSQTVMQRLIALVSKRSRLLHIISPARGYASAYGGRARSFIQVAQILADQAISRRQPSGAATWRGCKNLLRRSNTACQGSPETLAVVIGRFFPENRRCNLDVYRSLTKLPDEEVSTNNDENHDSGLDIRDKGGIVDARAEIFKLQAPYTTVQRMSTTTDVLISAVPFWEELSLGPFSGAKRITALCIFPDQESLSHPVLSFLDMTKGAYQACNLGLHETGVEHSAYSQGLVPMNAKQQPDGGRVYESHGICEKLGKTLVWLDLQGGNTVIYVLDCSKAGEGLPGICTMFLEMFEAYQSSLRGRHLAKPNDLVLQVVPSRFVFSAESIAIPTPTDYKSLAYEVYDRCVPNVKSSFGPSFPYMAAPAMRLSKPVPRSIDFRLVANASEMTSLDSDRNLHLAYSWTDSQQWLTASWSDSTGALQWNSAYWLGKDDINPSRPFVEAVGEICATTLEMLHPHRRARNLWVAKNGIFGNRELQIWVSLSSKLQAAGLSCAFLSVDPNPSLAFPPSIVVASNNSELSTLVTPGSTPFTSAMSPDVSAPVSSPAGATAQAGTPVPVTTFGDPDVEARLVDVADESWGVIMDRSIDDLSIASKKTTAIGAGYLIKRAGPRDEDGLLPMAVQVLHTLNPYRPLMKEVLAMYRDLATLARVRGITDPVTGVLPWHLAAADKAHAALNSTMDGFEGE